VQLFHGMTNGGFFSPCNLMHHLLKTALFLVFFSSSFDSAVHGDEAVDKPTTPTPEALRKLELPGIKLNLEERSVDVDAEVCLHDGLLELIACTKDSKEHESIVTLNARPMHIHTALLLLGARPGSPAMQRNETGGRIRWIPVPPSGERIGVSLVFPDTKGKLKEYPISKFVSPVYFEEFNASLSEKKVESFPSSFIFAGSHLVEDGPGPRKYICEYSGNVISVSTFGDELLCLPGVHGHQNGGLSWQVNSESLPKIGEKVILRLRPKKNIIK